MDASEHQPRPVRAETDAGPRTSTGQVVIRAMSKAARSLSLRGMDGNPRPAVRPPDLKKQTSFKAYRDKFPEDDMVEYLHRKYPHLKQRKWDFELEYREDSWVFRIPTSESDFTLADSNEFKRWRDEKVGSAEAAAATHSLQPQQTVVQSTVRNASRSPEPPLVRK